MWRAGRALGEAGWGGLIVPQGAVAVHSVDGNRINVLERPEGPPRTGEADGRGEAGSHALQKIPDARVRFACRRNGGGALFQARGELAHALLWSDFSGRTREAKQSNS